MNYKYEKEKKRIETIISYVVSISILVLTVIGNTSILMNQTYGDFYLALLKWCGSIIVVILVDIYILYFGKLYDTETKNFIKWYSYLLENGIKCNGYVKEITYVKQDAYKLKICYYSELQRKDIEFYAPIINIQDLDQNKKVLCNVYEVTKQKPEEDYDSEVINVSGNKIELTLNPFKLFKLVGRKYKREWFGNAIAVDFHYENE